MRLAWCSIVASFAAFYFSAAIVKPPGDGDLWWQRALGKAVITTHRIPRALGTETFTASGVPWVPQEWLFGSFVFLGTIHAENALVAILVAGCCITALVLTALRALRRGAAPSTVAAITAFTGLAFFESFGVRAQVVAWPLLAAFLLLLECEGAAAWLTIPLTILWANLHASAMLAVALAVTNAAGHALDERGWTPAVRRSVLIAFGTLFALCCTPLGWALPPYALTLFGSPIRQYIDEWRVTDISDWTFLVAALPLLGAAIAFGIGTPRRTWRDRLLFAAATYLLLTATRNIPIFVLVVAPLVAQSVSRRLAGIASMNWAGGSKRRVDLIFGSALTIASFVMIFTIVHAAEHAPRPKGTLPLRALAATQRLDGMHRIYCADFAWCGFYRDHPNDRVFLDGRADPFPVPIWRDYAAIRTLAPGWQTVLAKRGVDTLLVKRDSALGQAVALLPNWRSVYVDPAYRVYVLKPPPRNPSSRQRQMASCNTCGQFEIPLAPASRTVRPRPKIAILRKPMTVVVDRYRYNAPIW